MKFPCWMKVISQKVIEDSIVLDVTVNVWHPMFWFEMIKYYLKGK